MENYNEKETNRLGTFYYLNNKLHRTDGPAIEYINGDKKWYINNKRHRTDGPAIEYKNGDKLWWINGEYIGSSSNRFTQQKFEQYKKLICLR